MAFSKIVMISFKLDQMWTYNALDGTLTKQIEQELLD